MLDRLQLRSRLGMDASAVAAEIKRRLIAKYEVHLPLRAGAVEAVKCAASRYKVALATGSSNELADYVLRATGLDQIFLATLCGDEVEHGKPAPYIYLQVLAKIGVTPGHAVGVEDSGNGIRSLHAAGMRIIAAPGPEFALSPEVLALADARIGAMTEFSVALDALSSTAK